MGQQGVSPQRSAARDQVDVLNRIEGSFAASVLFALLKLRIFENVGEKRRTVEEVAEAIGARPETLARLLNAGVAFGFLETDNDQTYRLSSISSSVLLPSAGEAYLGNWLLNLDHFLQALTRLDEAVAKSAPVADPPHSLGEDPQRLREYILAWHNHAAPRARELAGQLNMNGRTSMLDLGCGAGTYAFELGLRNPSLQLALLDLPGVLEVAREVQSSYSLSNKICYLTADATRDEISGAYDLVLVSNILHVIGEKASRELVRRLYRAVNPGGCLVIQGQFLRDDRMGERWPVMVDLIQLCTTRAGRNHTVAETTGWMEEAGFARIEHLRMTLLNTNSLILGQRL